MESKSIIKNLLFIQLSIVLFSLVILIFGSRYALNNQSLNRIEKEKEKLSLIIFSKEETWRAWKELNLQTAIETEFNEIKNKNPIKTIKIIQKPDLNFSMSESCLYAPKNWKESHLIESIIEACIDLNRLEQDHNDALNYIYIGFFFLVSFFILVIFSAYFIHREIYKPFLQLNKSLNLIVIDHGLKVDHIRASGEIKEFINSLSILWKKSQELEKAQLFNEVAKMVSHDIRSPLTALQHLLPQLETIPEDKRIIIRTAVNRINDIANDLLNHGKKELNLNLISNSSNLEVTMLATLVDSVVSEKRISLRSNSNLIIESRLDKSYGLFAFINPVDIKRVLSNLITNSAEAIDVRNCS